ncbi:MAG TPA: helix-turn-helix domain-containing protein [Actinomycetota bacterium]|nr:helix-turn-helix domain-containing protein [Actinomycetota bacterium]
MPTVRDLLSTASLRGISPLGPSGLDSEVRDVALAEDLDDLAWAGRGSFVIIGRTASRAAPTYRFDVAVRRAAARAAACLAILEPWARSVSTTAAALAERAHIALVAVPEGTDLGGLAAALGREILRGAQAALARIEAGLEELLEAAEGADLEAVATAASRCLGRPVRVGPAGPDEISVPVVVLGERVAWFSAPTSGGRDPEATLVLSLAAHAVAGSLATLRRAEELPERSRAELLTELLAASADRSMRLLDRARVIGLPVDGWHVVGHVDLGEPLSGQPDEPSAFQLSETVADLALRLARASGGTWNLARSGSALLLVRTFPRDPGASAVRTMIELMERVVGLIRDRFPGLGPVAGVGGVHAGLAGLRASAAEARAAAGSARASGRAGAVAGFDAVGLRRMLVEWYASDSARESVRTLLAPLERLGPRRSEEAIKTLQTYLDEQGSVTRTARRLHLHRNAVLYRIRRIFEVLEVDPSDPDQRLALQLACRARLLP